MVWDRGHHYLDSLLYPSSVAIVGASDATNKWGGRAMTFLMKYGYQGRVYPVNNKYDEVLGLPCYPDVKSLPEAPDTVLVAVPGQSVYDVISECCEIGVKNAVIITAGFAEIDSAGKDRQEAIKEVARMAGLRIVGPNCLGIVNSAHRMALSSTLALRAGGGALLDGHVGFVSQSGAVSGLFMSQARESGIGLRYIISTGNEADLGLSDFMDYMIDDPDISVIATFIEGVRDGQRFLQVLDKALRAGKCIVTLKVGRSELGSKAAHSHTAALAGSDSTYDAVFKQNGVIRVDTLEELVNVTMLVSRCQLPAADGLGVIASSGGVCGIVSDRAAEIGVHLPSLRPEAATEIAEAMGLRFIQNPIDLLSQRSSGSAIPTIMRAFDTDPNIGAILTLGTSLPYMEHIDREIMAYAQSCHKQVIALSNGAILGPESVEKVKESGIPVFSGTDDCLKAIRGWMWRARFVSARRGRRPRVGTAPSVDRVETIRAWLTGKRGALTEPEAKSILAAYGIPVTREGVATSAQQAAEIARALGFPVALKIVSPEILHKTEARGIRLNLRTEEEVAAAFDEVLAAVQTYRPSAQLDGVVVQEMVTDGVETIVGMTKDADFGPTILFGLGGVFVEVLRDVAVRLAPIDGWDAHEMVREVKAYHVLEGVRGTSARDVAAVEDVLLKLSRLVGDLGDLIDEIDLNPLMVLGDGLGVKVVDALIIPRS